MSFRTRLSVLVAAAVAVSVIAASVTLYFVVRAQLLGQVDATLRERATSVRSVAVVLPGGTVAGGMVQSFNPGAGTGAFCAFTRSGALPSPPASCTKPVPFSDLPPPALGGAGGFTQYVDQQGHVTVAIDERVSLPVTADDRAVAAGAGNIIFEDATVAGTQVRIATAPAGSGLAVQVARPLDEVNTLLGHLRWILVGVGIGGIVLAAFLGRLVARTTLRPVDQLMSATEHVAGTSDLRQRIEEPGDDELGRLAHSFNRMLEALEQSQHTQHQLVADASHELRTPLSSLRTNVEVLARSRQLIPAERDRLLNDVVGQLERLSRLVADLIDLARGDQPDSQVRADVRLDEVVATAVTTARPHFPDVHFTLTADPTIIEGDPQRLERAVANLLDNAGKWSPQGACVEVRVSDGEVSVRDHGPGIDPDHIAHVFDRFWRAPEARQKPGSGLGLAIVRQVVAGHGGAVSVEAASGGGALLRMRFPSVSYAIPQPR